MLFTAKWCGYYARAKAYLARSGSLTRSTISIPPKGMRAYVAAGGSRGVPVLLYKTEKVQGFFPAGVRHAVRRCTIAQAKLQVRRYVRTSFCVMEAPENGWF